MDWRIWWVFSDPVTYNKGRECRLHYMTCVRCFRKVMHQEFKYWPIRALDSNSWLWSWSQANTIVSKNAGRSRYKPSVNEESSIKLMKMLLFFTVPREIESSAPCGKSHYSTNTYYMDHIACSILSSPPLLCYVTVYDKTRHDCMVHVWCNACS